MGKPTKEKALFNEIQTSSKTPLFISENASDYAKSMKQLAENNLKPLTYEDALALSSELMRELKGKWFYLDGIGIEADGIYTFTEKGELSKLAGDEPLDRKVHVWKGKEPLFLWVYPNAYDKTLGVRFGLVGSKTGFVAPVVVGLQNS